MTDVKCVSCGQSFEAKSLRAKYCGATCRKRGSRAGTTVAALAQPEPSVTTLVDAVRQELAEADRLDTVEGQQAVLLAERMVNGGTTASSVASLNKELNVVRAQALAGTKPRVPDALDELEQRRAQKAAGA